MATGSTDVRVALGMEAEVVLPAGLNSNYYQAINNLCTICETYMVAKGALLKFCSAFGFDEVATFSTFDQQHLAQRKCIRLCS